ncbi:type II toxin-antitoxin system Phd/YefM family antitoxin [Desulfosporosinus sp. SYSU MS00001]|uniref:type II toxin-antitoxin system Phd/YefM family antitoxin n=1 Tax=Desulfosporosinus sp. SYSU MS00001 TaxID=3416284 RepID=UPI003CF9184D
MYITATELKSKMGKYLEMAAEEEIIIVKNGKKVAKLIPAKEDKVEIAKSLFGILPSDASLEEARKERLSKHERVD